MKKAVYLFLLIFGFLNFEVQAQTPEVRILPLLPPEVHLPSDIAAQNCKQELRLKKSQHSLRLLRIRELLLRASIAKFDLPAEKRLNYLKLLERPTQTHPRAWHGKAMAQVAKKEALLAFQRGYQAVEIAALFEEFYRAILLYDHDSWYMDGFRATDGSYVYAGGLGAFLFVINPQGIFSGSSKDLLIRGDFNKEAPPITLDYSRLQKREFP